MTSPAFVDAARVPNALKPQAFGLWAIRRVSIRSLANNCVRAEFRDKVGFDSQTLLHRWSMKSLHEEYGEVVMEDSRRELQKHLAIWMNAAGKVLVTGLGLGCVVRGLLASPAVEHITVIEIDPQILRIVGREFVSNPRVTLVRGDALKIRLTGQFDYAWHDLWTDGDRHLDCLHAELLCRFSKQCRFQGAWNLTRWFKRRMPKWVLQ